MHDGENYSVTMIGEYAFLGCTGLTSITIPESVTEIGDDAFYNCTALTTLNYNAESCTYYYNEVHHFQNCPLETVIIGENVKRIPANFLNGQDAVTSITIPEGVTDIGFQAFSGCTGLTSITIPDSVTDIGTEAFKGCTSLTSITIPESVTQIQDYAFSGCTSLTTLNFNAESCTYSYYGFYPFLNCPLETVIIGENVKQIPAYFMSGQDAVSSITIPEGVTYIGTDAFNGCTGLTTLNFNAENYLSSSYYTPDCPLETVIIGENVKRIPASFMSGQDAVSSITIPEAVTEIGRNAFNGCTGLTSLHVLNDTVDIGESVNITQLGHLDSLTINISGFAQLTSDNIDNTTNTLEYLHITSGEMSGECFDFIKRQNTTMKTLIMEDCTNTTMSQMLLNGFTSLDSLVLPSGTEIIPYKFAADCISLKSITIPASVVEIDHNAFVACFSLEEMKVKAMYPPEIKQTTFTNVSRTMPVYVPQGTSTAYKAHQYWGEFNIIGEGEFTVTFNANGGEGDMTPQLFLEDSVMTISENTFTRDGYEFLGWTTTDSTVVVYADEAEYTATSDTVFYAVWSANEYTLSFDVEGISDITVTYDAAIGDLPVATRNGYSFEGWKIDDDVITDTTVWNFTEDKEAVAQWEVISSNGDIESNTVNFILNGNTLVFSEEQEVQVYTMAGVCIFSGKAQEVNIAQTGVYVVKTESAVTKIVVP